MSSRTIALVAITCASLLWSTAPTVSKILLATFDPFALAFLRFFIAALVILPFYLKHNQSKLKQLTRDILPVAILSSLNITFFYFGLKYTTATATTIIYAASPLMVGILARIIIKESLPQRKLLGILIGFVGMLIILLLPVIEKGQPFSGDLWGNLLILIAIICWSLYTIGSRQLIIHKKYSPLTLTAVSFFISTVLFYILTVFLSQPNYFRPLLDIKIAILIVHLAVLVTVATYLLYQWTIKHSSATTASLTNYLQPVFAIALAIIFLGERITSGFVVGSLLVICGVFLATGTQLLNQVKKLRSYIK